MQDYPELYCGPPGFTFSQLLSSRYTNKFQNVFSGCQFFLLHKARVGIRYVCKMLEVGSGDEILVPAYNCGSEVDALLNSGVSVEMFRVDSNCQIDICDLKRRISSQTKAVYMIHYFGFPQHLTELHYICKEKGVPLIEDCAHALFSLEGKERVGGIGDMALYNISKSLPVPDGGVLVINNQDFKIKEWQLNAPSATKIFKDSLPLFKRLLLRITERHGNLFPFFWEKIYRGETDFNLNESSKPEIPKSYYYDKALNNCGISKISKRLFSFFDEMEVRERRRSNFNAYLSLLSNVKGLRVLYDSLPSGVCPLCFPIIINSRKKISMSLKGLSINAVEWWSGYHRDLPWSEYPEACYLKDNLLTLPLHQQLDSMHIRYISEKVIEILNEVSCQKS